MVSEGLAMGTPHRNPRQRLPCGSGTKAAFQA